MEGGVRKKGSRGGEEGKRERDVVSISSCLHPPYSYQASILPLPLLSPSFHHQQNSLITITLTTTHGITNR